MDKERKDLLRYSAQVDGLGEDVGSSKYIFTDVGDILHDINDEYRSSELPKFMKRHKAKKQLKAVKKIVNAFGENAWYISSAIMVAYMVQIISIYGGQYKSAVKHVSDNSVMFRKRINERDSVVCVITDIPPADNLKGKEYIVNARYICYENKKATLQFTDAPLYRLIIEPELLSEEKIDAEMLKSIIHKEILDDMCSYLQDMITRTERVINDGK